jgi:hypothetical protein
VSDEKKLKSKSKTKELKLRPGRPKDSKRELKEVKATKLQVKDDRDQGKVSKKNTVN